MNAQDKRRAVRRVIAAAVVAAGVIAVTSSPASAATTATFSPGSGVLTVFGDSTDNTIAISRNAAGGILVNSGAIGVAGGTPTVANTALIRVFGQNGQDAIGLNQAFGALPAAHLFGGAGNDTLEGGSGADQLAGDSGHDTLLGRGGFDQLFGGTDDDTLTGGDADDQVFGQSGDDRMLWNPGDDTDLDEGGDGSDTVQVNGGGGAEVFTTTANGTRVRFDRLDPAPFSLDIGTSEKLVLKANGGNDSHAATGNLAALIGMSVDGGAGDDDLRGSNGADQLAGGDGDDVVDGQQGNDVAFLGAGDDSFRWDPGDGSDTLEGQGDTDTMQFNGSAAGELFEASADGGRLRFTRNFGNVVIDADDLEHLSLKTLGGTDTLTVGDLSGTDVEEIDPDLAGSLGTILVDGTGGNDIVDVVGAGTSVSVLGLAPRVNITHSEGADDALVIDALGGDDGVTATTLPAGVIKLKADGGPGEDHLLGSQGADVLDGGDKDDFVFGDNGTDLALMGAGDDVFEWNPGDGNDTLEGQDGADRMRFVGANVGESINIAANGGRVLFLRNVANVAMDLDDVEDIDFRALGGADTIAVGDLTGTDVTHNALDLRGPNGGGDGAADTVSVNGTQGDDVAGAAGDVGGVDVSGLHAAVDILHQEQANDRLTLNGLGGDDTIDAGSLEADGIQLTINGGLGEDRLLGSAGDDLVSGGDGNDEALMGAGDDTFVWNPGDDDDTLEGQAGFDRMRFNGSNVAEKIDVAAVGGRVRVSRDVASVTMDLDDVETVGFRALGGADDVVVDDLSGTDVTAVDVDLAAAWGMGDGQPDDVVLQGTNDDDVIVVAGDAAGVAALGLAARVNITGAEAANDRLTINALAGDDIVEASGLAAGAIRLTAAGGDGADVLVGSDGNDVLLGGAGDDVLLGGLGTDVIDGGDGDDVEIQSLVTSATAAEKERLRRLVQDASSTTLGPGPRIETP